MKREPSNDDLLLHALADGELDAATTLAIEQRIGADPELAAEFDRIVALKQAIKRLEKPVITDDFRARIAALASTRAVTSSNAWAKRMLWPAADWRAMAASVVVTAFVASMATYTLTAPRSSVSIEDAIVSGHRRSLLAASPVDVASSDRHTVRPWFDEKLGVSPPTIDLTSAGFPLIGGRVDVVGDKAVPSLVYRHRAHLITVLAIPVMPGETAIEGPTSMTTGGYNMVRWGQAGFRYWAVSDLDAPELNNLVSQLRSK